eukprot:6731533-Alexandrium_andersonii.AAC.1
MTNCGRWASTDTTRHAYLTSSDARTCGLPSGPDMSTTSSSTCKEASVEMCLAGATAVDAESPPSKDPPRASDPKRSGALASRGLRGPP